MKVPKAAAGRHTRRWPASLAVVVALGLQLAVPAQLMDTPRWIMPAIGAALLVPLVWTNPFHLRWLPGFTDYLFVAFTAATAFSPTDTMPLTARAKTLMGIQSAISLLTIAVVAARAVNVL